MQKSNWKKFILNDFIEFNPKIQLKKGSMATKVDMDKLAPFTRKITGYQIAEFMGGSKFSNKDTLLARITPCLENGKTAHVDILHEGEVAFGSTEFIVLRAKVNISDPLFIYYLSISPVFREKTISLMSGTSGRQRVDVNALKQISFDLPPLEEQKRIAGVLGAFDDKIELLQKQNTTLENMAKALFKSWFVDFDVVHAKQQGRPKAAIMQQYHLTEELYNLFPSSFEPSALAPIPTGWQVKPLSQIATFLNGLALQKYSTNNKINFLPVIKIAELRNGLSASSDKASCDIPAEYIVFNGDILFSWSGSLMVKIWSGPKGALNQHLFKVSSLDYPKWFYYMWIKEYLPFFQEIAADKATTMGHIQRKHLDQALVCIPQNLNIYTRYFAKLIDKQILNNKQIQTLTEMRDALLPRLISGKIRV